MPALDVPFITELRPFEDLTLASAVRPDATGTPTTATLNSFSAMVSSIHFEEFTDPDRSDDDAKTEKKSTRSAVGKDVDVRVTLVANMQLPSTGGSGSTKSSAELRCVTLASHVFRARGQSASSHASALNTEDTALVTLKTPLLFSSVGTVRSLSVLAHVLPPAGTEATSLKTYRGARLFKVRLLGVQQTVLTAEQVLLLAGARK